MDVNRHVILDRPYQGNGWWIFLGLFSLFLLFRALRGFRQKRDAGRPADARTAIAAVIVFLGFFAVACFQVLTHQW